jgi:hypothetical protein
MVFGRGAWPSADVVLVPFGSIWLGGSENNCLQFGKQIRAKIKKVDDQLKPIERSQAFGFDLIARHPARGWSRELSRSIITSTHVPAIQGQPFGEVEKCAARKADTLIWWNDTQFQSVEIFLFNEFNHGLERCDVAVPNLVNE